MDNLLLTPEAFYAGWAKARTDLLRASVERVFALLAASRVDDEAWRTAVAGETFLWRALREAEAPDGPPRFATIHRRSVELLNHLTEAGDGPRAAVERADVELLARSTARMDEAVRLARAVFAAVLQQLTDAPKVGAGS